MAALLGADDDWVAVCCTPALLNAQVPVQREVAVRTKRGELRKHVELLRHAVAPAEVRAMKHVCVEALLSQRRPTNI